MAVQVYIWGASDTSTFGHVSIGLSNGTYISWWPAKQATLLRKNVQGKPIVNLLEDIKLEGGISPKTYTLVLLDEDNMQRFWNDFQSKGDQEWELLSLNCATVAYNVLSEGHKFFKGYKPPVWTPSEVERIVKKYMEECMKREACGGKKVKTAKKKVGLF